MKKTLLIVLLLSFGFSQQIIHTETYENGNIKSITYHKKSRTGIEKIKYEEYYENGEKEEEETYKDGKLDGLSTWWYENGQKLREGTYKDGKLDGLSTWWYENGQKKSEGNYKDGKRNGLRTGWHKNGQKWFEETYKDGEPKGPYTEWYQNGQKLREGTYKDGEFISSICWDEDGNEIECN